MRDFLNGILAFIAAESLTDLEWLTVDADIPVYDQASYDALSAVLTSRESVSTMHDRLNSFYSAKGVSFTPATTGTTNIFVGAVL